MHRFQFARWSARQSFSGAHKADPDNPVEVVDNKREAYLSAIDTVLTMQSRCRPSDFSILRLHSTRRTPDL
jgi:hypothetical protein